MPISNRDRLTARIVYEGPIVAPVEAGTRIGELRVSIGDTLSQETPLYAAESVGVGSLRLNVDALPGTTCVSSKSYLPEGEFEGWYDHSCTIASSTAKTIFIFPDNMEASIGANAKVRSVALLKVPCEPRICKLLID